MTNTDTIELRQIPDIVLIMIEFQVSVKVLLGRVVLRVLGGIQSTVMSQCTMFDARGEGVCVCVPLPKLIQ